MFRKLKKKINDYLQRLEKANEQSFGNGKLNCCDLKGYQKSTNSYKE